MQKPKEITALNSRLRKIHNMTNNNALPVLGTDELDTDVESETGLLDINDVPHNSPAGRTLVPTLPVGSAEVEMVEFSNSDPEAVVVLHQTTALVTGSPSSSTDYSFLVQPCSCSSGPDRFSV